MSTGAVLDRHPPSIFARYMYRGRRFRRPARHRFLPWLTGADRDAVGGMAVAVVLAGVVTLATSLIG